MYLQDFFLSSITENITHDSNALKSFLYYQGALTHSKTLPEYLVIPNTIAGEEFLEQATNMVNWKQNNFEELKSNIIKLIKDDDISELFSSVEKICFSQLSEIQVFNHNEYGLSQAFFDALRFSFFDMSLKQEYIVKTNFRYKYAINMVIDSIKKRIFIEFKNISVGYC